MIVVSDEQGNTNESEQELEGYDEDVLHNGTMINYVFYIFIFEHSVKGETLSHDRSPHNNYIIIHVCAQQR